MDTKNRSRPGLSALAGVQRGLTADLLGLPVDTVANVADLGLAGYGSFMGAIGRPDLAPDLLERTQLIGSGDWVAQKLSRTGALMGPIDPDSETDRAAFAFGRGSSGAILGLRGGLRPAIKVGAFGGTSALVAEQVGASTGNPALAAAAALLVDRGRKPPRDMGRPAGGDRPSPSMRKTEAGTEWQQLIADTLASLLAKKSDSGRSSALNSPEYRSYRGGIDEFGVQPDVPRRRGLGENPFYKKTFSEIDWILSERDFAKKGTDPSRGIGSYFHPRSGRKYYLDQGSQYGKITELPHVDVHRMRDGLNLEKEGKHKFPLGDALTQRNKR